MRLYIWNRVCEIVFMRVWEQVCKRVWESECPFECEWRERLCVECLGFGGKQSVPANFPSLLDSKRKTLRQKEHTHSWWRKPLASNPVLWYRLRGIVEVLSQEDGCLVTMSGFAITEVEWALLFCVVLWCCRSWRQELLGVNLMWVLPELEDWIPLMIISS